MIQYIKNEQHYELLINQLSKVKHTLWIGTADIKDLYVEVGKEKKPFLALIAMIIRRGVEVRLIHAKEPGQAFREDFDKYPALWSKMERRLCPRVHMKIVVMDSELVYIGSANLTGAGMGMKSAANRNFEAGILTDELGFIDAAMSHFDSIWEGTHCKQCGRKDFCLDCIKEK